VLAVVERVLGEFYWEVHRGEAVRAQDFVAPEVGLVLSCERSAGRDAHEELQWSLGRYVDGKALFRAFHVDAAPPPVSGIAPNQPSPARRAAISMTWMAAIFGAVWIAMVIAINASASQKSVYARSIEVPLAEAPVTPAGINEDGTEAPAPVAGEPAPEPEPPAFYSEPFTIAKGTNVEAKLSTDVDQSFLWVGGALIEQESGAVHEFELEASYYHGVDDGESWSEGSPNVSTTVSGLAAGSYVLRLMPVMDTKAACSMPGTRCPTTFRLSLVNDVATNWPGVIAFVLIAIGPILAWLRAFSFEKRRWSESNVTNLYSGSNDD
jgi:hypothetical protein